jgi:hypothetical protein
METAVLTGAAGTIARCRPVIYFEAKRGDNTKVCLRFLKERGYHLYWHFATFFERNNFRQRADNVFGATGDINALAIPEERGAEADLPTIENEDSDWQKSYAEWRK